MRHIEARGIGYEKGYTTLEGFLALLDPSEPWTELLDIRTHLFDDGKFAANAGLGFRYVEERVWGINVYYDFRFSPHEDYHQLGAGIESLGDLWDFRANWYHPIKRQKSSSFDRKFEDTEDGRKHYKCKREYVMKGVNAEIGAHSSEMTWGTLYAAMGPYYLEDQKKHTWGGEARLTFETLDYIRLECSGSYDQIFHGIVQGQISLMIPLGTKKEVPLREGYTCPQEQMLRKRMMQTVDRSEIIPIEKRRSKTSRPVKIVP